MAPEEDAFVDPEDEGSPLDSDVDRFFELAYRELKALARRHLDGERPNHTLQPTALLHEAYARLVDNAFVPKNDAHFYGAIAEAMRRILVDHARGRLTRKRGGQAERVPLDDDLVWSIDRPREVLDIDRALTKLGEQYPEEAETVVFRFFCGMTYEEISKITDCGVRTIKRRWKLARALLHDDLSR